MALVSENVVIVNFKDISIEIRVKPNNLLLIYMEIVSIKMESRKFIFTTPILISKKPEKIDFQREIYQRLKFQRIINALNGKC